MEAGHEAFVLIAVAGVCTVIQFGVRSRVGGVLAGRAGGPAVTAAWSAGKATTEEGPAARNCRGWT